MPTEELPIVTVTEARPVDWEAVRDLRLAALADTPEAFCATLEAERQLDQAAWRARIERPRCRTLIAWLEQEAVGLVEIEPWDDGEVAGIGGVWVAPDGRGLGVGDALIAEVLEVARRRGYTRAALEVGDHNVYAQELYARHGFVATGRTSTMPPPKEHVTEHELARDL